MLAPGQLLFGRFIVVRHCGGRGDVDWRLYCVDVHGGISATRRVENRRHVNAAIAASEEVRRTRSETIAIQFRKIGNDKPHPAFRVRRRPCAVAAAEGALTRADCPFARWTGGAQFEADGTAMTAALENGFGQCAIRMPGGHLHTAEKPASATSARAPPFHRLPAKRRRCAGTHRTWRRAGGRRDGRFRRKRYRRCVAIRPTRLAAGRTTLRGRGGARHGTGGAPFRSWRARCGQSIPDCRWFPTGRDRPRESSAEPGDHLEAEAWSLSHVHLMAFQ